MNQDALSLHPQSEKQSTVAGFSTKNLEKRFRKIWRVEKESLSLQSLSDFRKARSKAASVPRSGVENRKFFFENIVL